MKTRKLQKKRLKCYLVTQLSVPVLPDRCTGLQILRTGGGLAQFGSSYQYHLGQVLGQPMIIIY